jgi:capsular exopolysaccharide synthesis family protein
MLETKQNTFAISAPTSPVPESDDINLLQLFGTLWRGKWTIVVCAIVMGLAGGYYAYEIAVPKYTATTVLTLQLRSERVVDLDSVIAGVATDNAALNTELEVIRSRGLIEQLVAELGLLKDPEFNEALRPEPKFSIVKILTAAQEWTGLITPGPFAPSEQTLLNATVRAVRQAISVTNLRDTYVFKIAASTGRAEKSALISNTLAELYILDQVEVKFQATENAVNWLAERVNTLEAELGIKEREVKDLQSNSELVSTEALDVLSRQAKNVRDRLVETKAARSTAQVKMGEIQELQRVGDDAAKAARLNDPELIQLYANLETGGDQARGFFDARFEVLATRIRSNLQRTFQQVEALEIAAARFQKRIEDQASALVHLEQMEREVEATSVLYETFLTRLKETTVQRGLQQADSRILSAATPGRRVAPRTSRIVGLTIILGGLLGAGAVLLQQLVNNGFRTADELETFTGLPVLGQIPLVKIKKRDLLIQYLKERPTSAVAEAIRNLRTSVLLSDLDKQPQVIMSTSSIPGEGKTTQAIALAQNLSGLGKKVLLIEGDIRRRTFTQYFGQNPMGGILSALSGEVPLDQIVTFDAQLGADVLMGEKSTASATDIFSSDRFVNFLKKARAAYDFIVIDTPPVLFVPDARVIGQSVDAIIYSVNWDSTSKAQVAEGLRQFSSVSLRVTGVVLAKIDPKGMQRYGYGGKYGAYSRYGKAYDEL